MPHRTKEDIPEPEMKASVPEIEAETEAGPKK